MLTQEVRVELVRRLTARGFEVGRVAAELGVAAPAFSQRLPKNVRRGKDKLKACPTKCPTKCPTEGEDPVAWARFEKRWDKVPWYEEYKGLVTRGRPFREAVYMAWKLAPKSGMANEGRTPKHQWELAFMVGMSQDGFRNWLRGRREALNAAMEEWKENGMAAVRVEEKKRLDYEDIFGWIVEYKGEHDGNSPTLREIMKGMGIKSTGHMVTILGRLEELGKVYRKDGKLCVRENL